jgi:murein DD-endopeptidase MepM/ murein hydrolase activator NlpD
MVAGSLQVNVGDTVNLWNKLGRMGATGNVTGRHLHLECSTTQSWQCSTFLNPCTILGIPNVDNTIVHYDGSIPPTPPEPPTPTGETKKKKFPWVLYANKFRKRN